MRVAWALVLVGACADQDGVVVTIHAPEQDVLSADTELRLYAGLGIETERYTNPRAGWRLDDDPTVDPGVPGDGVSWRDPDQPFRAWLNPGDGAIGDEVMVIAEADGAGFTAGALDTPAKLSDPAQGAAIQLEVTGNGPRLRDRCADDADNLIFFDPADLDCDGDTWRWPYDCADTERGSYPMFWEKSCCNADQTPPVLVVRRTDPMNPAPCSIDLTCNPDDPAATAAHWTSDDATKCDCAAEPDLLGCYSAADVGCTVLQALDGSVCDPAVGQLRAPDSTSQCRWRVMGRIGAYRLEFANGGTETDVCDPYIRVTLATPPAGLSWAVLDFNGQVVLVRLEAMTGCVGPPAIICSEL